MNRVPDLYLEDERSDFRTGLYHLPARFERVFIRDKFSSVDNRFFKAGEKSKIDSTILHQKLKPFTRKNAQLPDKGFLNYFINPGELDNMKYKNLDFVIVPRPRFYYSYYDLCKKTGRPFDTTPGIPQDIVKKTKPVSLKNKTIRGNNIHDTSKPNSNNEKDIKIIKSIRQNYAGIYLSDVVRLLCNKHPTEHITIIVSACRSFHEDLPKPVRQNQCKSARVSVNNYLKKYSGK